MQQILNFKAVILLFAFLNLISAGGVNAQDLISEADLLTSQGDVLYYKEGKKELALNKYREALDKNPENLKANYMAGLCYIQSFRKSLSLVYFLKVYDKNQSFVTEVKTNSDLFPDLEFLIAKAYQSGNNFKRASEFYEKFEKSLKANTASRFALLHKGEAVRAASRKKNECFVAEDLLKFPIERFVENQKTLNSAYPDYGPVLSADNKTLYFTSRRPGGPSSTLDEDLHFYEDIYISSKNDSGIWDAPKPVAALNTVGHESVAGISLDGQTLFLSKGDNNGDLYTCTSTGKDQWENPVTIGNKINSPYRETACFQTSDGKKLYFTSDRPGGLGGLDIYMSRKRSNGKWGVPVNLGTKINSPADEDSPCLTKDGKFLIYSSKGSKSMGGYDFLIAPMDSTGLPKEPSRNFGYPANSSDDDNTFFPEDSLNQGYFTSYRENGMGDLDIYHLQKDRPLSDSILKDMSEFKDLAAKNTPLLEDRLNEFSKDSSVTQAYEADLAAVLDSTLANKGQENNHGGILPEEYSYPGNSQAYYKYDPKKDLVPSSRQNRETAIRILVLDTESKLPLDADVLFTVMKTNEIIHPRRIRNGVYEIALQNQRNVELMASIDKNGYYFKNIRILAPAAGRETSIIISRNVELRRHLLNRPRILRNVFFDFDQAIVKSESFPELDMLVNTLNSDPKMIIEVAGHADFVGDESYNYNLSLERAKNVLQYLVEKGIDKARLRPRGYGENIPVPGTDDSDEGRARNRRTEFTIIAR